MEAITDSVCVHFLHKGLKYFITMQMTIFRYYRFKSYLLSVLKFFRYVGINVSSGTQQMS